MAGSKYGDGAQISGSLAVSGSATFNEESEDVDFRIESDNRPYAFYVDAAADRNGLGCFTTPNHNIEIQHEGADGDEGIMIIRYDGAVYPDNILGGIGFDSADGNRPSRTTEASAYIAGYASEHHSTTDKGGYLVFGTADDDDDDDTASYERVRITSAGNMGVALVSPSASLDVDGTTQVTKNSNGAGAKAKLILAKSRGSAGSETVIQSGNSIGAIEFNAYDGNTWETAASISGSIATTAGDGDVPGKLHFSTTSDGKADSETRLTIDERGNLLVAPEGITAHGNANTSIFIHNGAQPRGETTNCVALTALSGELWAYDVSGNGTQLTPHPNGSGDWIYYSKNWKTGKTVKIHMEKLMKKLNDFLGEDLFEEWQQDIT